MEKIRTLNPDTGLTGLIAEPAHSSVQGASATNKKNSTPALIFANVAWHQAGPSRINTELCRLLAKNGYLSIRYTVTDQDRAAALLDAMNCLATIHGSDNFVVFASGPESEYVLELAEQDTRVKGLHLIDVTAIKTKMFYFHKYFLFAPRRIFELRQWRAWMAILKHSLSVNYLDLEHEPTFNKFGESLSTPRLSSNKLRYLLWSLFRRNTQMHLVYTGSAQRFYNHNSQFDTMTDELERNQHATSSFFARADHWLIHSDERNRVIDETLSWVHSRFPPKEAHDIQDVA